MKQFELPVTKPVFRLKGGTLSASVLELAAVAPDLLAQQLAQKVAQAPQLLRHSPVIIALDKLGEADGPLDLDGLLSTCRAQGLQPVAVRALRAGDLAQAAALGIAILPLVGGRERVRDSVDAEPVVADAPLAAAPASASAADTAPAAEAHPPGASAPARPTRVVTQPVRGGQQVYAEGDLVLLAPVSAGAEVMAGGHIHVYAPLRGRALAGVQGDAGARIFCREMSAELVAIAGHYRIADDLRGHARWGQSAQLFLHDDALAIVAL